MAKYLSNMVSILVGGLPYLLKVKPATEGTSFFREYRHCKTGEEGECAACANAYAGMESGIAPFCVSLDSRFIGIEKFVKTKKGVYGVGTVWRSDQGKFQKKFDKNKQALLNSPDAVGKVTLYPYPKREKKSGKSGPSGKHTGNGHPQVRKIAIPGSKRGALKRAQRSGMFPKAAA